MFFVCCALLFVVRRSLFVVGCGVLVVDVRCFVRCSLFGFGLLGAYRYFRC